MGGITALAAWTRGSWAGQWILVLRKCLCSAVKPWGMGYFDCHHLSGLNTQGAVKELSTHEQPEGLCGPALPVFNQQAEKPPWNALRWGDVQMSSFMATSKGGWWWQFCMSWVVWHSPVGGWGRRQVPVCVCCGISVSFCTALATFLPCTKWSHGY